MCADIWGWGWVWVWGWGWGWQIPCNLDPTFAGLVEAWASGVSWKELMDECGVDEGDVARLLRRTIDMLSQVMSAVELSVKRMGAAGNWGIECRCRRHCGAHNV